MLLIPAIDLIDGSCVRLTRGDYRFKKKYSDDPVLVAEEWKKCGASWLHVVDLDGARTGRLKNLNIALDIKAGTGLKVQYGGGIRSAEKLKLVINNGIDRAIIGTGAFEDRDFLKTALSIAGQKCILSIDFDSSGMIYKHGWQQDTHLNIFSFLKGLEGSGIKEVILTNISRDGTLEGIDKRLIEKIIGITSFKIIIAGGVSGIEDILKLKSLEDKGICGIIIGKALYEGKIDLKDAISVAEG